MGIPSQNKSRISWTLQENRNIIEEHSRNQVSIAFGELTYSIIEEHDSDAGEETDQTRRNYAGISNPSAEELPL